MAAEVAARRRSVDDHQDPPGRSRIAHVGPPVVVDPRSPPQARRDRRVGCGSRSSPTTTVAPGVARRASCRRNSPNISTLEAVAVAATPGWSAASCTPWPPIPVSSISRSTSATLRRGSSPATGARPWRCGSDGRHRSAFGGSGMTGDQREPTLVDLSLYETAFGRGAPSGALVDVVLRTWPQAPQSSSARTTLDVPACPCGRAPGTSPPHRCSRTRSTGPRRSATCCWIHRVRDRRRDPALRSARALFSPPYPIERMDWGAANPDGVYRRALLRGDRTYRLSGRLGNAQYFSFDFRPSTGTDTILRDDFEVADDGTFEISSADPDAHLLGGALAPTTTSITTRRVLRRLVGSERPARSASSASTVTARRWPGHSSRRVAAAFDAVGEWIWQGGVRFWAERTFGMLETIKNQFEATLRRVGTKLPDQPPRRVGARARRGAGDGVPRPRGDVLGLSARVLVVAHARVRQPPDLVELSLRRTATPDGIYRFVLSAEDPGVHNWLDTMGLHRGIVDVRFHRPTHRGGRRAPSW